MIDIALVGGKQYLDVATKKVYKVGKSYSVTDAVAKRLLKMRTQKGKFFFGKVVADTEVSAMSTVSKQEVADMGKEKVPVIENPQAADIVELD